MERRLDAALSKLDAIKADTAFIRQAILASKTGQLGGALLAAQIMEANGRFDDLAGPLETFEAARLFYEAQMRSILDKKPCLAFGAAFVEFASLYVLATGAKGRALTLLRGEAEAARAIAADAAAYRDLRQRLLAPLDDPEAGLVELVTSTDEAEATLEASLPWLPSAAAAEYMPLPGLGAT